MGCTTRTALLALCCLTTPAAAQQPQKQERRAERIERLRIEGRENNLFFTVATGLASHNQSVMTFKAEYSRQIRGGLYWGTTFSARLHGFNPTDYDWSGNGSDPYRNTLDQDIYKADGMVYYRFQVVASRLYFRLGAGAGVGYHHIRTIGDRPGYADRVLPYFNVEAAWILRLSRSCEMKLSPTIVLVPSEFAVSPVQLGTPTDITPWLTDAGFSLTLGWRF